MVETGAFIHVHVPSSASQAHCNVQAICAVTACQLIDVDGGEQTLVGLTSSGLLVNQDVKCA